MSYINKILFIICSFFMVMQVQAQTNLTNLSNVQFDGRKDIETSTENLIINSESPYDLSMPLIISAQLGNDFLYRHALSKMTSALHNIENNPDTFLLWLYGRTLFAAYSIGDKETLSVMHKNFFSLWGKIYQNDQKPQDRFAIWALGYATAVNKEEYIKFKDLMVKSAHVITQNYYVDNSKQDLKSDALWSWVMIAQSAANAQDKTTYKEALDQMLNITNTTSVAQALNSGLLRTSSSNDYPAWAIAIVTMSAQTIKDVANFSQLQMTLAHSIEEAKLANKIPEELLSRVIQELILLGSVDS